MHTFYMLEKLQLYNQSLVMKMQPNAETVSNIWMRTQFTYITVFWRHACKSRGPQSKRYVGIIHLYIYVCGLSNPQIHKSRGYVSNIYMCVCVDWQIHKSTNPEDTWAMYICVCKVKVNPWLHISKRYVSYIHLYVCGKGKSMNPLIHTMRQPYIYMCVCGRMVVLLTQDDHAPLCLCSC